jgi:hypothetical protein
VAKGRTIPIAVSVVGIERDDQQLSLGLTCNGVKLRVNDDWLLNGREVRAEAINCDKATVITLFIAIKHFEPPRARIHITARIKNSNAQKRIVVDVLQKIGSIAPPAAPINSSSSSSSNKQSKPSSMASPRALPPPSGAPAPAALRELGLDETELTSVADVGDDSTANATHYVANGK